MYRIIVILSFSFLLFSCKNKTVFERKLELGMEGHRFFDLVRWGIADVVLNNEYFPKEGARRVESLGGSVFTKGKHEYLPIPGSVITASIVDGVPTLKQNPGY